MHSTSRSLPTTMTKAAQMTALMENLRIQALPGHETCGETLRGREPRR